MCLDILSLWGRNWSHGAFLPNSMCVDFITSFLVDIILYAFMLRKLSRSHGIPLGKEPWVIVFHFSRFCSMCRFFLIWNIFVSHAAMSIAISWILQVLRKYQTFSTEELWHAINKNPEEAFEIIVLLFDWENIVRNYFLEIITVLKELGEKVHGVLPPFLLCLYYSEQ